ncbi:hypothetical protein ACP70R_042920 [Stipagrostis hirtigluma subsp. patula]
MRSPPQPTSPPRDSISTGAASSTSITLRAAKTAAAAASAVARDDGGGGGDRGDGSRCVGGRVRRVPPCDAAADQRADEEERQAPEHELEDLVEVELDVDPPHSEARHGKNKNKNTSRRKGNSAIDAEEKAIAAPLNLGPMIPPPAKHELPPTLTGGRPEELPEIGMVGRVLCPVLVAEIGKIGRRRRTRHGASPKNGKRRGKQSKVAR